MMGILPQGRGLFAISDPGAAKAVLAHACRLQEEERPDFMVISDKEHDFYADFNIDVSVVTTSEFESIEASFKPDYLLTGTSYTSTFELDAVQFAASIQIPSFSFVDHWTSMLDRFKYEGGHLFPNKILVIDDKAAMIAGEEGIPEDRISVAGNPYYEYLQGWTPALSREEFLKGANVDTVNEKIIAFLPEPLSNVGGIDKYGIDEYSTLSTFFTALGSLNPDAAHVLIKLHPNQNIAEMKEKASNLAEEHGVRYQIVEADINTLIAHSDLIVGMFSNALIEASLIGIPVLRILIDLKIVDPLEGLNIGSTARNSSALNEQLITQL